MDNMKLVVAQIEKDTENNPLFYEDFFSDPPRKWEPRYDNAYPNVIYDEKYKKYRCYYTLCSKDKDSASASREERTRRVTAVAHTHRLPWICRERRRRTLGETEPWVCGF